jgi:hypothetical protein
MTLDVAVFLSLSPVPAADPIVDLRPAGRRERHAPGE